MRKFEEAVQFALKHHAGQVRKRTTNPYILHPMEVATIAATLTEDEDVLTAAILHDTIEDTDATIEEIRELFGKRVALLVMTETEEKRPDIPSEQTWLVRKEETLLMLENTKDDGVRILWLSDKLANMRSFARQYKEKGDNLWLDYNQKDPAMQAWYYFSIARYLLPLSHSEAYQEYISLVKEVFKNQNGGEL